jgi:tetratricopeptide (TPR) repeat protein
MALHISSICRYRLVFLLPVMLRIVVAAGVLIGLALPALAAPGGAKVGPAADPAPLAAAVKQALSRCQDLLAKGKQREAYPILLQARQAVGEPRDPRIETLLGKVALAENAPDKALEFVGPYADNRGKYDPALSDCYLVAGDACLAAQKHYQALTLFDWMAANSQGTELILAAEGCGKALMGLKEYGKAAEALDFAVRRINAAPYGLDEPARRIKALLKEAQRLRDIGLYGEDFVLYRDAETLRRIQKKPKEARAAYLDLMKRFPDGPYAEASQLYAAMCLAETDKIAEAERELTALRQANPYGPYGGEAILELGRIALERHLNPGAARGCFLLLDTWIQEVRSRPVLNITRLAVPAAALKVTTPPQDEKYTDFWGNVKKSAVKPGMLVNPKTCPWYLDDLKEQMAMYMGFLCFVEGKKDEALAWYAKILECDPATRRMQTDETANDFTRLKWGAEHGYLVAYPQDLAIYKDARQRLAVLLTDFYYVTQRWDKAAEMPRLLLKGEFGPLTGRSREYPQFALAQATYWAQGPNAAVPEYLNVIGSARGEFRTLTQFRAAFCAANLATQFGNEALMKQAREILVALVRSPQQNDETYKARVTLGRELLKEGHVEEGLLLFKTFPAEAGAYKELADHYYPIYLKEYGQKTGERRQ